MSCYVSLYKAWKTNSVKGFWGEIKKLLSKKSSSNNFNEIHSNLLFNHFKNLLNAHENETLINNGNSDETTIPTNLKYGDFLNELIQYEEIFAGLKQLKMIKPQKVME